MPGVAAAILFVFAWLLPAAAVLGVLILLQWPVLVVLLHLSERQRDRLRKERRELRLLKEPFQKRPISAQVPRL